jgi:uncharacterized protein (DUF2147 family)
MRAILLTGFAALLSMIAVGHAVSADTSSPVGLWQSTDPDTKQPTGWFFITNHDGVYDGALVRMFLQPGEDPNVVCDKCRDDRHDQKWLGLQIIRGMKPDEDDRNKYTGGTILDPRDGNIYSAMMTLSPDGQTLIIRGYLGISLLGRNEYWTRLPDSDISMLDPSIKSTLDPSILNAPANGKPSQPSGSAHHH